MKAADYCDKARDGFDIFDYFDFWQRRFPDGEICLAGGCVRDHFLGRKPKDIDVFLLFDASREQVEDAIADLTKATPLDWHKSEPFLQAEVELHGTKHQIMNPKVSSVAELLDGFDWNVSRFALEKGQSPTFGMPLEDIGPGLPLELHKVTYPQSTLRRGFRYSERFQMEFLRPDIEHLCAKVALNAMLRDAKKKATEES